MLLLQVKLLLLVLRTRLQGLAFTFSLHSGLTALGKLDKIETVRIFQHDDLITNSDLSALEDLIANSLAHEVSHHHVVTGLPALGFLDLALISVGNREGF